MEIELCFDEDAITLQSRFYEVYKDWVLRAYHIEVDEDLFSDEYATFRDAGLQLLDKVRICKASREPINQPCDENEEVIEYKAHMHCVNCCNGYQRGVKASQCNIIKGMSIKLTKMHRYFVEA